MTTLGEISEKLDETNLDQAGGAQNGKTDNPDRR
jgi:hypothetical protein